MNIRVRNEENQQRLEVAYERFALHVVKLLQSGRNLGRQTLASAIEATWHLSAVGDLKNAAGEHAGKHPRHHDSETLAHEPHEPHQPHESQ